MPNLFHRAWGQWVPDADVENAPQGTLLRADNVVRDQTGALALRQGSEVLFQHGITMEGTRTISQNPVHSLRSFIIGGNAMVFSAADDPSANNGARVYLNGEDLSATPFDGSGDVAFGTDSYQAFMARGKGKMKHDGSNFYRWDIPAPTVAPTLAAAATVTKEVASFDSTESPAFTITEGTSAFVTAADLTTANGALKLSSDAGTGRASAYRKWSSDQDYLNFLGTIGGDSDLFDCYIAFAKPEKVETITYMFGLNTGTDPFRDDYYYFDFNIRDRNTVNIKDATSSVQGVNASAATSVVAQLAPEDVTRVKTPQEVMRVLARLGRFAGARSRERKDAVQSSPAWGHLSTTRAQFNRVGQTSGRDWRTVRGFKVVVKMVPGVAQDASFDSAIFYGGGIRSLTGKFKVAYRYARDTGTYVEMSPISPVSNEITLNQQGLNITISATAIGAADKQVNQLWIYLYGGYLDTYYRVAVVGAATRTTTMAMDEFAPQADGAIDAADRTRFTQHGLTIPGVSPNTDHVVLLMKSEVDAIRENVVLEPGGVGPPDNIVAIEGPMASRMFCVTSEGWLYPSLPESPSNFSVYQAIDLRRWGTPLWAKIGSGGLHIGMTADVIRIDGTGDESADRSQIDLWPTPLSVANPPVDASVYGDGNTIIYRAADGLMTISGSSVAPVSQEGMLLLWRGIQRHGVNGLDIITGRFRIAVDNHRLYMLAPEGSGATGGSTSIYRYRGDEWNRFVYPTPMWSLYRGPDGRLLSGDDVGRIWEIETDLSTDNGSTIPVEIRSAVEDGGSPLQGKTPLDLQAGLETGGMGAVLSFYKNGENASYYAFAPNASGGNVYRASASGMGDFNRLQFKLTGSFSQFVLRYLNLSYRSHPQQVMAVDTGYLTCPNNAQWGWIGTVEVCAKSPYDLEVIPVFDDVEQDPISLPVVANKASVYSTMLRRGQDKGRRPIIRVRTTSPDGAGEIGAEIYWIRVHFSGTGNRTEKDVVVNFGSINASEGAA